MARGFVSNLATPAFLVGTDGTLVFYNEAAAELLGVGFEEAGPIPAQEWGTRFEPIGLDGQQLRVEELPLSIALTEGRPAHTAMRIQATTRAERAIADAAFTHDVHEVR